jgi:N-acetyl-gamma-glutamyl-phosphate reductase
MTIDTDTPLGSAPQEVAPQTPGGGGQPKRFKAAVYGATGYIGAELVRRLILHPDVELVRVCAADHLGKPLGAAHPNLEGFTDLIITAVPADESQVERVDVVFLALPHEVSWRVVAQLQHTGTRILDCSGAFRVDKASEYERFYGNVHPLPDLLPQFVYGLCELNREAIKETRWLASPGCFATTAELGLLPLALAGVLRGDVYSVGITGSSGAGSTALPTTHHPTRSANLRSYSPLTHPHSPEILQTLEHAGGKHLSIHFVPVAGPLARGILVNSFVQVPATVTQGQLDSWVDAAFTPGGFVRRPKERLPEVIAVAGSNFAEVKLVAGPVEGEVRTVTAISALDNLLKGGAGQAIQNMNLMLGLREDTALRDPGPYP